MAPDVHRVKSRASALAALVLTGGLLLVAGGLLLLDTLSRSPGAPASEAYAQAIEARSPLEPASHAPLASVRSTSESPVVEPVAERHLAAPERIAIPAIGVDSSLVALNITPDGYMDVPNTPDLVGWYDFTSKPGLGGNAVFSGHVDFRNHGPAVFWDLRNVEAGDSIAVALRDGTVMQYEVTASQSFSLEDIDMAAVLAPTAQESITLITCGGEFVQGGYDHRLVVRAVLTGVDAAS